nr:isoamylase 2, chloroplastic [Ipomoea batatas]
MASTSKELVNPSSVASQQCIEHIHKEELEHVEQIHKSLLLSELDGSLGELVMFWRLFRFDAKSLMSLDSQSVELDFEQRLAPFYLAFFLKSKLGYGVNKSEIKSHMKSKIQSIGSTKYILIVSHTLNFDVEGAMHALRRELSEGL